MSWTRDLQPADFAVGVPKTPQGWIDWDRDTQLRRQFFVPDAMAHPAKANIHMLLDIMRYVSKEGELILDPFGGIGSSMMMCLYGRNVMTLEIEELYFHLQQENWEIVKEMATGNFMPFLGDNRLLMPKVKVDHIITSPPYSNVLENPDYRLVAQSAEDERRGSLLAAYGNRSPSNIGALNPFFYNQQMVRVYKLMVQAVRPGGTVTTIIKDFTEAGKRVYLSTWVEKVFKDMGVPLKYWVKRKTRGIASDVRKSQGLSTIEDEDIMIFERPIP